MAHASYPPGMGGSRDWDKETHELDDKLRCCICNGYFDLKERHPRLLRCSHAICQVCFVVNLRESSEVRCRRCSFSTKMTGANLQQLDDDQWAICIMRFLTPKRAGGDLSRVDIPRLLITLRGQVELEYMSNDVAAMTVNGGNGSGTPSVAAGPGPSTSYPGVASVASSSRADAQKMRDLLSQRQVAVSGLAVRTAAMSRGGVAAGFGMPGSGEHTLMVEDPPRGIPQQQRGPILQQPGGSHGALAPQDLPQYGSRVMSTSVDVQAPSAHQGSGGSVMYHTPAVKRENQQPLEFRMPFEEDSMDTSDAAIDEDRYRQADRSGIMDVRTYTNVFQLEQERETGHEGAHGDGRRIGGNSNRENLFKPPNVPVDDVDVNSQAEKERQRRKNSDSASSSRPVPKKRSASPSHSVSRDAHGHNRRRDAEGRNLLDDDDDRRSARSQLPQRRHGNQQRERKPPARRQQSLPRRRQPEIPAHVEASDSTSSDSSSEAEGIPSTGAKSKPPRRRAPSPAFSTASSRRGAGNSAEPVIINPNLDQFAVPVKKLTKEESDETCNICMGKLKEESPYEDAYMNNRAVIRLRCGHALHHHCAVEMLSNQADKTFVTCPSCTQTHGTRIGDQPEDGRMIVTLEKSDWELVARKKSSKGWGVSNPFGKGSKSSDEYFNSLPLPGFPGTDTIVIEYRFKAGIQGPNHPSPGSGYMVTGFPRTAYLPRTGQGYQVLCMLKIAFERRLIFTIGTSSTSGAPNNLVWAGIHHKTYKSGGEHGYPDQGYLDRVTEELKAVGITPADIPPNPAVSLGFGF